MTDHELLEAAAKAAGKDLTDYAWEQDHECAHFICYAGDATHFWNPLTDDGDVARLEAMLGLNVIWGARAVRVGRKLIKDAPMVERYQDHDNNRQKARRWASVRAAAAIGGKT